MRTATDDARITFVSAQWRLLEVESLEPRTSPIVCPFGKDQVLILGGYNYDDLSDRIIWNTTTKELDRIKEFGRLEVVSFNPG